MIEGLHIKIPGKGLGLEIATGTGFFSYTIDEPKVAICRKCGEISMYVEHPENIDQFLEEEK
jgi:hypothetical protein